MKGFLEPCGEAFGIGAGGGIDKDHSLHGASGEIHFPGFGFVEKFLVPFGSHSEHEIVLAGDSAGHVSVHEEAESAEHFLFAESGFGAEEGAESIGEKVGGRHLVFKIS